MNEKVSNILITGGAGYIGSHVAERLIKIKSNIIVLDNLSSGNRRLINKKTIFIKVDLKNIKLLVFFNIFLYSRVRYSRHSL